jgi:prepilin-type N-terminal cleavage/methylation domain-containing protein
MLRRLNSQSGMTLIEVLVAMVVLAFGVMALVAAFVSGLVAIQRGTKVTTAGTLADKQMEIYRQMAFPSIPVGVQSPVTSSGPSGGTYWLQATISWTCIVGTPNTTTSSTPPTCDSTPTPSRPVKMVSIDVRDTSSTGKRLANETSTFDSSTG